MLTVRFLLVLTDDIWGDIYYWCGHCADQIHSQDLEGHALNEHGIHAIEIINDGANV
jgi:hypothetical protein